MKKLTVVVFAVVVSVLMTMSAQATEVHNKGSNRLDLYEKVNTKYYFSSNDADDGDTTYARLDFKGETQTNDQLAGFGQWKYEFRGSRVKSQGSSKDKTRLVFVGLKFGDCGSTNYGRNYGVAYDISTWTDVLPESGGDTQTQADVFMTGHTTGVATYRNNDFPGLIDGLDFAAQYQGKNDRGDFDNYAEGNGDGLDFSAAYEYEGFGTGATYAKSDRTDTQVNVGRVLPKVFTSGKNAKVWAASLEYNANNIYLATTYSETQSVTVFADHFTASKARDFEAAAQYQPDFDLCPSVACPQPKGKDLGVQGDQGLVEYVDVGVTHYFNKNISTFADYKTDLLDKNDLTRALGVSTDDTVATDLAYQFQSDYKKDMLREALSPQHINGSLKLPPLGAQSCF